MGVIIPALRSLASGLGAAPGRRFGGTARGAFTRHQSEFATWLQCGAQFSRHARGAAFCELVGATTTYIVTGEKPGLRADLPRAELVAACDADGWLRRLPPPVPRLERRDGRTSESGGGQC